MEIKSTANSQWGQQPDNSYGEWTLLEVDSPAGGGIVSRRIPILRTTWAIMQVQDQPELHSKHGVKGKQKQKNVDSSGISKSLDKCNPFNNLKATSISKFPTLTPVWHHKYLLL
jgi:hypothetical protein